MVNLHEIHFEITNACPHNCLHCSTGMIEYENVNTLLKAITLSTIDQIAKIPGNPKVIHLTGGEPLCHNNIIDIVKYIKDCNIIPSVFTTGFAFKFDEKTRQKIVHAVDVNTLEKLAKAGLEEAVFSIHSTRPEIHNEIMQTQECLENELFAINKLVELGVKVKFNCVPMSLNRNYIEEVVKYAKDSGIKEVRFLRFVCQGNAVNNPRLYMNRKEMVETVQSIVKLSERYTTKDFKVVSEGYPQYLKCRPFDFIEDGCQAGKSLVHINLNRDVLPCPAFKQKKQYFAGNLRQDTLKDIWFNSPVFINLRHLTQSDLNNPCKMCPDYVGCYGGCVAQRSWSGEDIYHSPDPICIKPEVIDV